MTRILLLWFALGSAIGAALPASAEAQSMGGALAQQSRATIQISVSTMPRFETENHAATEGRNGDLIALAPPKLKSNAPNLRYATVIVPPDEPSDVRSAGITNDDLVPGSVRPSSVTTAATGRQPLLVLIVPD